MRISDWSSDVCSSDLVAARRHRAAPALAVPIRVDRADIGMAPREERLGRPSPACFVLLVRHLPGPGGAQAAHPCGRLPAPVTGDRKSVVKGTSVSVRVDLGGCRSIKKKKKKKQ